MQTRLLLVSIAATVLGLGGCRISGGGGLDSAVDPTKKATFGFIGDCDGASGLAQGQLQYQDHGGPWGPNGYKVAAHGTVDGVLFPCTTTSNNTYTGTYEPQPGKLGNGGTFSVTLVDGGEPGPSNGDTIEVRFAGGVFDGYVNAGSINGGNIQLQHVQVPLP